MKSLFKGIDEYEKTFVGSKRNYDHNEDDNLLFNRDNMYFIMFVNDILSDKR